MANDSVVIVEGIDKTVEKMWKYNLDFYNRARKITQQASKTVEQEFRARAPVGKTGNLRNSIKAKNILNRGEGPAYTVMPRRRRSGQYKGYHRAMVTYGTAPRTQKSGRRTGIMPGNDFTQGVGRTADAQFNAQLKAEAARDVYI